MSIESKVRELLNGNAAVNYRIHFPDGERPDICNANIEQESISMSEKVCSQDTLKFGLCEASSFQCTVADIEEKHITANKAEGSTISINDSIAAPVIEFSLYGKSTQGEKPTPDAPQEIHTIGSTENVVVKTVGKNLFNTGTGSSTSNGVEWSWENNRIVGNGTPTGNTYTVRFVFEPVNKKGVYAFSLQGIHEGTVFEIHVRDGEGKDLTTFQGSASVLVDLSKLSGAKDFYFVVKRQKSSIPVNCDAYLQIEEGTVETTYQPYTEATASIPTLNGLAGIPVTTGENYTDGSRWISDEIIKYGDGTGKRIQRIGVLTLDGSETITAALGENKTEKTRYFKVSHDGAAKYPDGGNMIVFPGLCSHFERKAFYDVYWQTATEVGNSISMSGAGTIAITHTGCSTVSEFKTWLAANHVTVLYELATPVETDLTAEEVAEIEKISTFDGTTTISNSAACHMKVQYRCNTYSGEMIKNPKPLRGNIKGCRIQVFLEVDISSLSEAEITEYGQTADDVDYTFYRIPMGEYTVDSCKKQTNMDMRQIIAYDSLKSDVLDKSCRDWFFYAESKAGITTLHDMKYSLQAYYEIDMGLERICDDNYEYPESYIDDNGQPIGDFCRNFFSDFDRYIARPYMAGEEAIFHSKVKKTINETYKGKVLIQAKYNLNEVKRYNEYCNEREDSELGYTVEQRLEEIRRGMLGTIENKLEIPYGIPTDVTNSSGSGLYGTMTLTHNLYAAMVNSVDETGQVTAWKFVDVFKIINSIVIYKIPDDVDAIPFLISFDAENQNFNVDENRMTVRNMLSAMLETEAEFGTSHGSVILGGKHCTLTNQRTLSESRRLNVSDECVIHANEQQSVWYDEDGIGVYGMVAIQGEDADHVLMDVKFNAGSKKYIVEGNLLLDSGLYDTHYMYTICKRIFDRLQCIRMIPVQAVTSGLPFRHAGDFITFEDEGEYINSYVLTKDTDGVCNAITDNLDSTNIDE